MKIKTKLKTQAQAVIYFIQQLDVEMVNTLLDDTLTYQNMQSDFFIDKLGDVFIEFINSGDTFL